MMRKMMEEKRYWSANRKKMFKKQRSGWKLVLRKTAREATSNLHMFTSRFVVSVLCNNLRTMSWCGNAFEWPLATSETLLQQSMPLLLLLFVSLSTLPFRRNCWRTMPMEENMILYSPSHFPLHHRHHTLKQFHKTFYCYSIIITFTSYALFILFLF